LTSLQFGLAVTVGSEGFFRVWVYSAGRIIEKIGSHKFKLTNIGIMH
jgi:hypothetical protein